MAPPGRAPPGGGGTANKARKGGAPRKEAAAPEMPTCECGYTFADSSPYCAKCGTARPETGPDQRDHELKLVHAFGVYPAPIRDAVTAIGDDSFAFCVGRHVAICDQTKKKLKFVPRDAERMVITAMAKSPSGKLLAVAEKHCLEEGSSQITIMSLASFTGKGQQGKEVTLKVLTPRKGLDIVGLAFTPDAKHLISLSGMPDSTLTYWKWEQEKAVSSHDIQLPVTRLKVNPKNHNVMSISGPHYLRTWEYNSNDSQLTEHPSVFALKTEKSVNVVDHTWVLDQFLCAITEDGHAHIFEDMEHLQDVDIRAVITKDESTGAKAAQREQEKLIAKMMGVGAPGAGQEPDPVKLICLAAWSRGFVVGGDQGYLGVFKVDSKGQVEAFGTFRMPGEKSCLWGMSTGSDDTNLTILSYEEKETDDPAKSGVGGGEKAMSKMKTDGGPMRTTATSMGGRSRASIADEASDRMEFPEDKDRSWNLTTFPVGQADMAATGQLETFAPVFELGTHNGRISGLSACVNRRVVATCGDDMNMRLWSYPNEELRDHPNAFSSELCIKVSSFEKPRHLAMHPLGFQVAVVLDDVVRIYHLTTANSTRTLFDLPLKRPGDVAYSNSGSLLAATSDNDVVLIDPWRAAVVHIFTGSGGHLSAVNQLVFSEDDKLLLSCSAAPSGAIYGWDVDSETKNTRVFEHVAKNIDYGCMAYDFRKQLAVACTRPEGAIRMIGHSNSVLIDVPAEENEPYTALCLSAPLNILFAGTELGSVRFFRWPLCEGGTAENPFMQVTLHSHSVTQLSMCCNSRLLFSACEGGTMMASEVNAVPLNGGAMMSAAQVDQCYMKFRHKTDIVPAGKANKVNREDERKFFELQKKLTEAVSIGLSTNASLDDLVLVPKSSLEELRFEIRELEDRMQATKHEGEYALEQKEQETSDKLNTMKYDSQHQRQTADDKYDSLFVQFKKTNERHQEEMDRANAAFEQRARELTDQYETSIAKEYDKQSMLLQEVQNLKEKAVADSKSVEQQNASQIDDMRSASERAMREWRGEYDKVCSLLKSDGLKFEEALRQQETEYEGQITEILEHKRAALQLESEKSSTAMKDGVSMKQTIVMLQKQLVVNTEKLQESNKEGKDLQKKLATSQEMFEKVQEQLQEERRALKVKGESLTKIREQMKHLESFRFVLFHKVKQMEEERDPLAEQVNSLKSSVREMYSEFVREFRLKQKLDQQLNDKSTLSVALQTENVMLRSHITQLKKDARRMFTDMEQVLHPDSAHDFEKMPKLLQAVVEKYKKMAQWQPPTDHDGKAVMAKPDPQSGSSTNDKDQAMIEEMVMQRDMLFRKNQIAVASAAQAKRECGTDFRRLTTENAALIAEMNTLRNENRSLTRSCKEMEQQMRTLGKGAKGGGAGGSTMARTESAPDLDSNARSTQRSSGSGAGTSETTPYMRRKIVDKQEMHRRKVQQGMNQLPPVAGPGGGESPARASTKPSMQEKRFAQTLEDMNSSQQQLQRQGFNLGTLREGIATEEMVDVSPGGDGVSS